MDPLGDGTEVSLLPRGWDSPHRSEWVSSAGTHQQAIANFVIGCIGAGVGVMHWTMMDPFAMGTFTYTRVKVDGTVTTYWSI